MPLVSELFHFVSYSYTIKYLKLISNVNATRVTAPCCWLRVKKHYVTSPLPVRLDVTVFKLCCKVPPLPGLTGCILTGGLAGGLHTLK
jgi:hypothetical protein